MSRSIILPAFILLILISLSCGNSTDPTDDGEQEPLELTFVVVHVTSYGASDGAIDLTVTGGMPPYSFLWSNGETTEDIQNLSAGRYTVTVRDTAGDSAVSYTHLTLPTN